MAQRFVILFSIILFALVYTALSNRFMKEKLAEPTTIMANSVLKNLPDIEFKVFGTDEVYNVRKEAETKKLFIHFWATWCGPCEVEFPDLVKITNEHKGKDVEFLFVAVDDEVINVKKFFKKNKINTKNFKLLVDNKKIYKDYFGTMKLPETYLFAKKGQLLRKFLGPQKWAEPFYQQFFK
jgi:cytochrome c biogenesis protein CcmG/thiol:disulfide interchange protein DsbE